MKLLKYILTIPIVFAAITSSCLSDGSDTLVLNDATGYLGIPPDSDSDPNPPVGDEEVPGPIPDVPVIIEPELAYGYLTMSGIRNEAADEWLTLYGTNQPQQNVWLSIDGLPKGIDVFNLSSTAKNRYPVVYDVVFLMDNDITMSEEVTAVTNGMAGWARTMQTAGIDIRIGCVAYKEGRYSVNGAIDLTSAEEIQLYFDRFPGLKGTVGFGGSNADELRAAAESGLYSSGYNNECPMVALLFADDNFSFRSDAARVYVSMTDEANQPGKLSKWSVEQLNPAMDFWKASKGSIHTIFSGTPDYPELPLELENPWLMSEYTGGTVEFVPADFANLSLTGLKFSEALKHSYIIRFGNIEDYTDNRPHRLKITVRTPDGSVATERCFETVFVMK